MQTLTTEQYDALRVTNPRKRKATGFGAKIISEALNQGKTMAEAFANEEAATKAKASAYNYRRSQSLKPYVSIEQWGATVVVKLTTEGQKLHALKMLSEGQEGAQAANQLDAINEAISAHKSEAEALEAQEDKSEDMLARIAFLRGELMKLYPQQARAQRAVFLVDDQAQAAQLASAGVANTFASRPQEVGA